MAASLKDGPDIAYGPMAAISAAFGGSTGVVGDPNTDAGPNGVYQGAAMLDPRYYVQKDKITGYPGSLPAHLMMAQFRSVAQIPAALGASNIAAAQVTTSGTALTLASASLGVALNMPIIPYGFGGINGSLPVTAAIALDFGFAFGNCTSGSPTITVANSNDFVVGMPIVIAGVGNAGGTAPLLTNVATLGNGTSTITVQTAPLATNAAAPIGTGNIWGPNSNWSTLANMTPVAALPWLAGGVGLMLDPRQAIARGVRIVGVAGSTGGTFTVRGWDVYHTPMTETITVAAGANTGWGVKAFKYLGSVTPNFTDGTHNYTVGTSDVFGLHYRGINWDDLEVSWNSTYMASSTGFTAGLATNVTASATTADVRGTIQTSASGGGSGIGSTASNGTVSSLAMSGVRLTMQQSVPVSQSVFATPTSAASLFGVTQF